MSPWLVGFLVAALDYGSTVHRIEQGGMGWEANELMRGPHMGPAKLAQGALLGATLHYAERRNKKVGRALKVLAIVGGAFIVVRNEVVR